MRVGRIAIRPTHIFRWDLFGLKRAYLYYLTDLKEPCFDFA